MAKRYSTLLFLGLLFSSLAGLAQPVSFPDAPEVALAYQDGVMELQMWNNNPLSNNYEEAFESIDPSLPEGNNLWVFEGYQIYQIQFGFSNLDFNDPDVARLVAQVDIENESTDLFNSVYDGATQSCVTSQMVVAANAGIPDTIELTLDAWTQEPFIEGQIYCYIALAYATHPDGESADCPEMPYTYVESIQTPDGSLNLYCKTATNPVGIVEQASIDLSIYPNPASDQVKIQLVGTEGAVELLSLTGKVISTRSISADENEVQFDVAELPEGIYLIRFRDAERVETKRLVVRH